MGKPHKVTLQSACDFHMVLISHVKGKTEKGGYFKKNLNEKEESEQE